MTALDRALAEFHAHFAGDPDGVWEAPGRVNLIGEHTDYNGGLVLPIALPQRTYVAARRRQDTVLDLVSAGMPRHSPFRLDSIAPGHPAGWERYPAGVLWAMAESGQPVSGFDAAFASDVPVGSGLSSSAAIEAAIAAAASDLFGCGLLSDDSGRATLATWCQQAENHIAGAPTGGMDQAAVLRAREGHALNLNCADGSIHHVPFRLHDQGLALLVIDTRVEHSHATGEYGRRRADCEEACERLGVATLCEIPVTGLPAAMTRVNSQRLAQRVRHVITENQRVRLAVSAMAANDFIELGRLFVDSHASLRDDYEVSCPQLDLAVVTALEAGALGARMTGGGFGGSAIALVYEQALSTTQEALLTAFEHQSFTTPRFLVAEAARPACRTDLLRG
ncbi:MAG: galactokinase [Propionibacteriaceae bacterium]|nr:galactokinase [Propionibacteriaceae bacterium]